MIQRIQSVFLLIAAFFSVLFILGDFVSFTDAAGNILSLDLRAFALNSLSGSREIIGEAVPYTFIIILIPVLTLISIFLFRNRKAQMKMVTLVILLEIALILSLSLFALLVMKKYSGGLSFNLSLMYPVAALAFSWLALRGIRKDERLVRSYDRMR